MMIIKWKFHLIIFATTILTASTTLGPTKIIVSPQTQTIISGEEAIFYCLVDGNPFLPVRLLYNGIQKSNVISIPKGAMLRIPKVQMIQNNDRIDCVVRTPTGEETKTAHLKVIDPASELPTGFPKFNIQKDIYTGEVGQSLSLLCEAEGEPELGITWFKDNVPVDFSDSRRTLTSSGSLSFSRLLKEDNGIYECRAINSVGSALSIKKQLQIKNTPATPHWFYKPKDVEVRPGHGVNLTCKALGNPPPHLRWLTQYLRPINELSEKESILLLTDITEPATYICQANNSMGFIRHSVVVKVKKIPKPPVNVRVVDKGATYAIIAWVKNPAYRLPIDSYTLEIKDTSNELGDLGKKQLTDIQPWSSINDTVVKNVSDLSAFTIYSVKVFAVSNTLGMSDPSPTITFQTNELPPSTPPQSVYANADTPNSITVKWATPIKANGKIKSYNVFYTRNLRQPIDKWQKSETTRNYVHIKELFANHTYHISVSAINEAGPGPLSDPFPIIVRPGVPPQPQNFRGAGVTSTSINLIWTPPEMSSKLQLLNYELRYRIVSGSASPHSNIPHKEETINVTADRTDLRLSKLWPNTLYYISLAGRTKHGVGVAATLNVKTENRVPNPPRGIEIRATSPDSILIRWQKGVESQEPIISFQIKVTKLVNYEINSQVHEVSTITHSVPAKFQNQSHIYQHPITTLEPGHFYKVVLWSVSRSGLSAPYVFDPTKTISIMIPSPPLNIRLNQLRQKQEQGRTVLLADLAWDAPDNVHGTILGYRVRHRLVGPSNLIESLRQRSITPKEFVTNVTVTNYCSTVNDALGFGKVYEFSVAAINSNNDYGLEAKHNISTRENAPEKYPVLIQFIGVNSKSVNVTWQPSLPEFHNGVIMSYQVLYFLYGQKNTTSKNVNTAKEHALIEGLEENVVYVFQVRAYTKQGPGPWSPEVTFRTAVILPDPPVNIMANRINERQIKVTWELPNNRNIKIIGFRIFYCVKSMPKPIESCDTLDVGPVTMVTLTDLKFTADYQVALKSKGIDNRYGTLSEIVVAKMSNVPKLTELSVKNLHCDPKDRSIQITWRKPDMEKQLSKFLIRINGYNSYTDENGEVQKIPRSFKVREVNYDPEYTKFVIDLKDMEPNTVYDISVQTLYKKNENSNHYGTPQNTSCRTLMTRPVFVPAPEILYVNKTYLSVLFKIFRVSEKYGVIRRYYLIIEPFQNKNSSSHSKYSIESLKSTVVRQEGSPTLVAEFSSEVFRKSSNVTFWIGNDIWLSQSMKAFHLSDYLLLSPVNFDKKNSYAAFLRVCIYDEDNAYQLSLIHDRWEPCTDSSWSKEFDLEKAPTSATTTNRGSSTMKSSVFTVSIIAIIIGLGVFAVISIGVGCFINFKRRRVKRYYNSPQELIMNGDPSLKQALISQNNSAPPAYVPLSHSNGAADMDSSLKSNYKSNNIINHPPTPSSHLADYIQSLRANDNAKFTEEYESIDPGHQFTWTHSNLEANKPKNRYANVIAYDHSRVVLSTLKDVAGSDYINANYCDGYRKQNAYIATQGPLPETFEAFWRMVWENRSAVIVMMTKLEERLRVKCDQYWPTRGSDNYTESGLTVTHVDTVELAYYTMRKFTIAKKSPDPVNQETRDVLHFQFTAWPDHGVPDTPLPLLMFVRRVRSCSPTDVGPVIVHCSAGVGRTGAYIVIDSQLSQLQHEKAVDIYGTVCRLRAQRNYMVQTEEQYVFVYDTLLEASLCGNTEVSIRNLHAHVTKLKQPLPVLGVSPANQFSTGMELEFKHVSELSSRPKQFITANLTENRLKNRLINILPYENRRVCLQPIRNQDGSDYINASYVDGYRAQKSYIATQGPLANTVGDFWRMLWQHNSCIIVMLTHLREMGREKCSQYWPTDRAATFGQIIVEPMVEYNMPSFILREFRVRHTDSDTHNRTIRQFQFLDWPEQGVPRSGESLIDFIGQVHKTKEQFGQEGPITVHCSAGVGRTGVFLALSIVLDRMRSEGTIDLFQTVRLLRMQRPCMVQTEDQYQFCYLSALEYLSSFDHFMS